ncbi:MAG: amidohydrolase family protein, partial [Candidatus Thermoplasmatota archaeon]|nr:amidohydrolase family protein [Candidatus Thermoplasmatota archaeon]
TESDLICVKDNDVPVVVCPRSNAFFGLKPNIELMNEIGIDIMLGTDNAMLNAPNILDELNYVKNMTEIFSTEHLLNMITYNPRKALNLDYSILDLNSLDEFIVLDKKNLGVLYISGNQREI